MPTTGSHYFDNMETRMKYGPFDLSDASTAYVDFYLWLDTESTYDYLTLEVSGDGVNFQELNRWSGSAPSWQQPYRYFNNYLGDSSVWLAWRFHSDPTINAEGPWLDDLRIMKYVESAATPTRTPTKTLTPTITRTRTKTATRTKTRTPTISPTRTQSPTKTKTLTKTLTRTPTQTLTPTKTRTPTKTATVTRTATPKPTKTKTRTPTICPLSACTRTPTRTLTRTKTVCPLAACTATATKTPTPTKTPTLTNAPTWTPTITPTPNNNGSGFCWESGVSWSNYVVYYDIDSNVPASWIPSIEAAAQTWNDVTPSHFSFSRQLGSNNTVRYEVSNNPDSLAATSSPPPTGHILTAYTKINPNYPWDINNNFPSSTAYNAQSAVTHEFGHWLFLKDINDPNCTDVTMDFSIALGEVIKITLELADKNAINWQYP